MEKFFVLFLFFSRYQRACPSSTLVWRWYMVTCALKISLLIRVDPGRLWDLTSASLPATLQRLRWDSYRLLVVVDTQKRSFFFFFLFIQFNIIVLLCVFTCNNQVKYVCKEWDPNLPPLCLPNPEYVAPEYILSVSCDSASDMYSLGVVMHAVFNEGRPVFQVNKQDIFKSFSRQLDQVKRHYTVVHADFGLHGVVTILKGFFFNHMPK